MTISASLSSVSVSYFRGSGTSVIDGTQEADGQDYARVAATILDDASRPVPNAQVRFSLDAATPDTSFRAAHGIARPNSTGFVSYTNSLGVAYADVRSQDGAASPLTVNVLAGEDDQRIEDVPEPTTTTAGNQLALPHGTTVSTPLTVTANGTSYEDTLFEALVTVTADNVTFTNCTFDVGSAGASNCVRASGAAGLRFTQCTFTNSTGHAVAGHGFLAERCHWTDIGRSAVSISTADTSLTTEIRDSLLERFGSAAGVPGVVISPGSRVILEGNRIHGPHEGSSAGVAGFSGRGAVWIFTRRPNQATDIVIARNWIYGGGDSAIRAEALDSGNPPSGIRIENNRIGDPGVFQDPNGDGVAFAITATGVYAAGNVHAASGTVLSENTIDGVGWYHPAEYIDAQAAVDFLVDGGATATITPQITSPELSRPTALPISVFSSDIYRFRPTAQIAIRTGLGPLAPLVGEANDPPAGSGESAATAFPGSFSAETRGAGIPGYYDQYPTARVFPPTRAGSPSTATPVVQFASNDLYRTVFETVGTVDVTVTMSQIRASDTVISLAYSGGATGGGVDYTGPATVTILAGNTTAELTVAISDDEVPELDEVVVITMASSDGASVGVLDTARIRITNYNDLGVPLLAPSVQFGTQFFAVTEATPAPVVDIPIVMSETRGFDVDVDYSVVTANTTLQAAEYTDLTGGQITIPTGETQGTVQFRIEDDTEVELLEYLEIQIDSASGATIVGEQNVALVEVTSDDQNAQASVGFLVSGRIILEGGNADGVLTLSTAVSGTVTVPFTEVRAGGLTESEYTLTDPDNGNATVTSPITFLAGETTKRIRVTSLQDSVVEGTESLTLTLGTATGNATTTGTHTSYFVQINDDDVSGPGSDGELHGLVPERQTVDLTGYDIDVFPDRYEIQANGGLGISASTVMTADPANAALHAAVPIWEALNPGTIATLQTHANILTEGIPVRIRINGDCVNIGEEFHLGSSESGDWGIYPIVRDVVIFGASGDPTVDMIQTVVLKTRAADDVVGGAYDTRTRVAGNIQFERIGIEHTALDRCVGGVEEGDTLERSDADFGSIKFYGCRFLDSRTASPAAVLQRGIQWGVRVMSQRASYDIRGCHFDLAQEHAVYVDGVTDHLYMVNCTHEDADPRGTRGFSRAFAQVVGRTPSPTVPPKPQGTIVLMRNVVNDTVAGPILTYPAGFNGGGGADFAIESFEGDVYFVDNEHGGLSRAGSSGPQRGVINVFGSTLNGYTPHAQNGASTLHSAVHLYGDVCSFTDAGPAKSMYTLDGVATIEVRGFTHASPLQPGRSAFEVDRCGSDPYNQMAYLNGIPSEDASHGFFWDLRSPDWTSATSIPMAPWSYPGFYPGSRRVTSGRSRRLANFAAQTHVLTQAEVDSFDGTPVWETASPVTQKPEAGWPAATTGIPVGAEITVRLGHNQANSARSQKMRSITEQVIPFDRSFENIDSGDILQTEVTSSIISFAEGSGTMTFTYLDNWLNDAAHPSGTTEEVPEMTVKATGNPTSTSEPGVVRYAIDLASVTTSDVGIDTHDVYVYHSSLFGTVGWTFYTTPTVTFANTEGDTRVVYLTTSAATQMNEVVAVTWDAGASGVTGPTSSTYIIPPGSTRIGIPITGISSAVNGESATLTITGVTVEGVTAGNIHPDTALTIEFVTGYEPGPDTLGLPFEGDLPEFPRYTIPTASECHYIVEAGVYTSTSGGPSYTTMSSAYYNAIQEGVEGPIRFGVMDDAGHISVHYWNWKDFPQPGGGVHRLRLEVVGLTDVAIVGDMGWQTPYVTSEPQAEWVGYYNIGIRNRFGRPVSAGGDIDTVIIDGCWWLDNYNTPPQTLGMEHGLYIGLHHTLVWRRQQWRGETPGSDGPLITQHSGYLNTCTGGSTWVIENNLFGGGRTGFQLRPDRGSPSGIVPTGPCIVAGNIAEGRDFSGNSVGQGWNHETTYDGGVAMNVWVSPYSPVYVFRNRIHDSRRGCVLISGQGYSNAGGGNGGFIGWTNPAGFEILEVWVWENKWENSWLYQPDPTGAAPSTPTAQARNGSTNHAQSATIGLERIRIGPNEYQSTTTQPLALHSDFSVLQQVTHNDEPGIMIDSSLLSVSIADWTRPPGPETQFTVSNAQKLIWIERNTWE